MYRYTLSFSLLIIFMFVLAGCSGKSEQQLWNAAQKAQKEERLKEAADIFEKLADDYPQSINASKALFESAKIYHAGVVKNISQDESLNKGISIYKKIYNQYPKSEEAPKSLFMVGFIESNDLRRYDSATVAYKLFIEKYPDNEMVPSAKSELDNMGLSPQEIVKKNLVEKK
ncbi:MAG: tetratricopeptide repeat protein [Ignavibacteria bacterium]